MNFDTWGTSSALDVNSMSEVSRQIAVPQFGIAFIDIDNDGYLDLVTVNGTDVGPALFVFRNEGDGRFTDAGGLVGADQIPARNGRGLAVSDLDQDGDLDLVVSNSGAGPTLIRNDGGNKNHWVRIAPSGLHSNRPGVGTKIEVKAGRMWQKIEVQAGAGYLSESSLVPHFGLGATARVDTVRLLVDNGSDPTPKDNDGSTALIVARDAGNKEIIEIVEKALAPKPATAPDTVLTTAK